MARMLLTTEAVLEELELEDFDTDELTTTCSDHEFDDIEDVYLEDVEDDDDDNSAASPHSLPGIHQAEGRTPSLAGPLLPHHSLSLPLPQQWVLWLTSRRHR